MPDGHGTVCERRGIMAKKRKGTLQFRFYEVPQGEAALVLCGESWNRPYGHESLDLHFHNLTEIGICRHGAGTLYLEEDTMRYSDGTVTVIPEKFPHHTYSDGEVSNFWEYIFFDMRLLVEELYPQNLVYRNELVKALSREPLVTTAAKRPELARLITSITEETAAKRPMYRQMVRCYMHALVTELIRNAGDDTLLAGPGLKGTNMPQIAAALEYISGNYHKCITTAELASLCNMSETHFRRIFEEYINMTPTDYINLHRIQNACELMKKGNDSMETVAAKCGFATTSTFNRNFKKFLNTSPYQWKINPGNYEHKLLNYRISALKGW